MSRSLQGVLLQLVALALFVTMDSLLKVLVASHPVPQLMFVRFVFHTALVMLALKLWTGKVPIRSRAPGLQTLRSLCLATANAAIAVALIYIPLADATAVSFAAPVLVVTLAALWLGEKVSARRWVGVAIGFAGVMVALRPPFLTGEALHWAMLLPLVTAIANSFYQLLTRKLAGVDDPHTTFVHTSIAALVVTGLAQPFVWVTPAALDWPLFAALGLLGAAGHCILVLAFARAPASVLAPMSYAQLIWAGLAGVLVFGDWPDGWTLLGAGIIAAGGILVAVPERRSRPAPH
ncbi:DMT family transporter [Falsiroseomonas selenitidurans]|uniref:DMT family transporter n=1 Tax=Falsiroseomonas selenitidurans TaxID=2716335 RepID=A0ABX1E6L8_9PROT|nr:DMT family transporter [Falsiroseomonas selenitidurans]NKC31422.1 DMT family transporter [Falsiroseomonas selenitidurans]